MAKYEVIAPLLSRFREGVFVVHKVGERVDDLTKEEAERFLGLKAIARVGSDGRAQMPEPDPETPLLEPDLEDGQDTTVKPAVTPEPEPESESDGVADDQPAGPPRGNASLEEWAAYAKSQGATDEDLAGQSRDQIREQYGQATA